MISLNFTIEANYNDDGIYAIINRHNPNETIYKSA